VLLTLTQLAPAGVKRLATCSSLVPSSVKTSAKEWQERVKWPVLSHLRQSLSTGTWHKITYFIIIIIIFILFYYYYYYYYYVFVCVCIELMAGVGAFNTGPLMMGGGNKPNRSTKNRGGYSQYSYYPQGSWGDHRMGGAYYGPPTGYGVPIHLMGRHMGMDPSNLDFLDQFQGERLCWVSTLVSAPRQPG